MAIEPLKEKWNSFGWECVECDGNNIKDIQNTLTKIKSTKGKPKIIIANTTMGKGVKSIEDNHHWHGKAPTKEEATIFIDELNKCYGIK
jgi:transketolase